MADDEQEHVNTMVLLVFAEEGAYRAAVDDMDGGGTHVFKADSKRITLWGPMVGDPTAGGADGVETLKTMLRDLGVDDVDAPPGPPHTSCG